jgi:copper resistance protein C
VTPAPLEVALVFSEEVELKFSTIQVDDAKRARVDKGDVRRDGGDAKRLIVSVQPLAPGLYKVVWRVTSTDTHKTSGSYEFTVGQ